MDKLLTKFKQPIMYIIFGVLTTIINIVTYYICTRILDIDYLTSNIIAWVLSVAFAYITNKLWVFEAYNKDITSILKEMFLFVFSRLGTLLLDMILMYILISLLAIDDMIAKYFVQVVVIVLNYILSKLVVFKESR